GAATDRPDGAKGEVHESRGASLIPHEPSGQDDRGRGDEGKGVEHSEEALGHHYRGHPGSHGTQPRHDAEGDAHLRARHEEEDEGTEQERNQGWAVLRGGSSSSWIPDRAGRRDPLMMCTVSPMGKSAIKARPMGMAK